MPRTREEAEVQAADTTDIVRYKLSFSFPASGTMICEYMLIVQRIFSQRVLSCCLEKLRLHR